VTAVEEFAEFARVMFPRLRRTAFLLCGDWHTAEDLAQTALAKVFVSWRRIRRQDAVHAYTHRTLVNVYLSDPRSRAVVVLRYWADLSVEQVADVMGCSPGNVKKLSALALAKLRVTLGAAMAESGSSGLPPVEDHEPGGSRHG